jgi:outer membrane protein assembly factor BamB
MTLQELHCRRCGATLPTLDAAGMAVCQYCGQRYREGAPEPADEASAPPHRSASPVHVIAAAVLGLVVLAGVGAFLLADHDRAGETEPPAAPGGGERPPEEAAEEGPSDLGTGLPPTPPLGEAYDTVFYPANLAYDSVGGPPVAITVGARDAFLARFRSSSGADELFFVAVPAAGGPPLWKIGPLGTYSDGYLATHAVVLGEWAVLSDWRSTLRVAELATGEEVHALSLTDRVKELCASPGLGRVWFEQVDERALQLDPATGTLEEGARPPDCPEEAWVARRSPDEPRRVEVPGMAVAHPFVSGDDGVALGYRHPGTALPLVAGYDPGTLAVRWTEPLAQADPARVPAQEPHGALAGGRLVANYQVGTDEWYLTALDAHTGARLWDVRMPDVFSVDQIDSVTLGREYAYVGHMSSVEVYRLADGALVRVAGQEVYEGPEAEE